VTAMSGAVLLEWTFWLAAVGIVYAYVGYPLVLVALQKLGIAAARRSAAGSVENPSMTMIIPVHNEAGTIEAKLENTRQLEYPLGKLNIVFVSDNCTDGTTEAIAAQVDARTQLIVRHERGGKAAALNAALQSATTDLVVFSDASIMLAPDALRAIARPFADPAIGCVSGEDRIDALGGEGVYGRYELFIRRQETSLRSIVGASGSFYAQRRHLCQPFDAGLAPDFLSVLRTVEQGFRAVTEPAAVGTMSALNDPRDEFKRKVRTILRGITTLVLHARLLNPVKFGWFAFALWSHKVMRWLVPFFLLLLIASSALLGFRSWFYGSAFLLQAIFYAFAAMAIFGGKQIGDTLPARISVFFTTANAATLAAWLKFAMGARQELWSPTKR
jgi:cellulose synthase/poly-beta-1,6-N-acetylglucosamine synthase-like glycosyltransferase